MTPRRSAAPLRKTQAEATPAPSDVVVRQTEPGLASTLSAEDTRVILNERNGHLELTQGPVTIREEQGEIKASYGRFTEDGAARDQAVATLREACDPNGNVTATALTDVHRGPYEAACKAVGATKIGAATKSTFVPH